LNCSSCGNPLPPGVANCPVCGTPAPYVPGAQSTSPYDQTVASSPYEVPPNQQASTGYGTSPYGAPQQGSETPSNPYGYTQPAQVPYGGVAYPPPGAPIPPAPNPYGSYPPTGQPPPPNYGYPQGYPQGIPPGGYGVAPQPKKRSRVGLIIGIVVGVALLACVGISIAVIAAVNNGTKTAPNTTPKATGQTGAPSGKSIVSSAASILSNPQTSTDVDKNYVPTHVTSTFKTGQTIYVVFDINSGSQDGYIQAKWYADGQTVYTRSFHHSHENTVGYFTNDYTTATNDGVAELYWCTKQDCSDAQLAQVKHFTVTSSSFVPTSRQGIAMMQDIDRRNA